MTHQHSLVSTKSFLANSGYSFARFSLNNFTSVLGIIPSSAPGVSLVRGTEISRKSTEGLVYPAA